jgi:hypothetical protein
MYICVYIYIHIYTSLLQNQNNIDCYLSKQYLDLVFDIGNLSVALPGVVPDFIRRL